MKKFRRSFKFILLSLCVVIAMGGAAFWYYNQITDHIYRSIIVNMQELAEHDLNTIRESVFKTWDQLNAIHMRMLHYDYSSMSQMQESLHIEQVSSDMETIYYVSEDGVLYSGNYTNMENQDMASRIKETDGNFVMRYDLSDMVLPGFQKEYLVYGVSISPWEIDGVVFVGIIAQISIDSIQKDLIIQCYEGQGCSSIVDEDGYYIINIDKSLNIQMRQNFHTTHSKGEFLDSDMDIQVIDQNLRNGETFTTIYRDECGEEKVMIFQRIDQMDWYFILEVSRDVFTKQTYSILMLSLAAAVLVALAVGISLGLWYTMAKKSLLAKTQLEARSEFLSNMSHEIRTPLNGLIGLNHLMTQHIDDQVKMKEYLQKASYTAQYLMALVNDILDISKLQAGKVNFCMESANLDLILDNVISMQKENIEERGISFKLELDVTQPWIECDEIRVKQVLMNLLSNAAKFTSRGGTITLRAYQRKIEGAEDGVVETCFEVRDTGCGMSDEFQKHIFEVFTQERSHNPESQKGTGLGMAISFMLMKAMGGTLSVDSALGEGSNFYASFPARIVRGQDFAEKVLPAHEQIVKLENLSVLIAEDNELNAEILVEILKDYGITPSVVRNGKEAVEVFEASNPGEYSVILMDVQMPVMNGYEATKIIRSLERADSGTVTILACTANTFQEDIDRVKACGMNGFLGKPIDMAELIAAIQRQYCRIFSE